MLRSVRVALLLMADPPYPGPGIAVSPPAAPRTIPSSGDPSRHIRRGGFGTLGDTFIEAELARADGDA